MSLPIVDEDVSDDRLLTFGLVFGAGLGAILGVRMDDPAGGMGLGVAVGVAGALWLRHRRDDSASSE